MEAAAATRSPGRVAAVSDAVLDFGVLALACWTAAYHVCVVLRLGTTWALVATAVALVPCGVLAVSRPAGTVAGRQAPPAGRRRAAWTAIAAAASLAAAILFAFTDARWPVVWALWLAAGTAVLLGTDARRALPPAAGSAGAAVALAWAAALAIFSLFLVRPDGDDTYYLRSATWIAERGRFPLRDVLYSEEVLPALFFPPVPSYEPLVGTVARTASVSVPSLAYYGVAPLATALAVLALWRLLRTWRLPLTGLALTVAIVFLLTTVQPPELAGLGVDNHLPGNFFVGRSWQGKTILVAVLVPVLLALLQGYAERPSVRGLALLAAAGAAAAGLSTTGLFVVPVVAVAGLAPLALRSPGRALLGAAAAVAYPLAALAGTLAVDGRSPVKWPPQVVTPEELVPPALGTGVVGLVALGAALAGPLLLRHGPARATVGPVVLLVGCLFAPGVPSLVYDMTDLGRPLWRLVWAIPTAALAGVLATQLVPDRPAAALPAALAVCGALAVWGTLAWNGASTTVADRPAWKRPPHVAVALELLARARPGDLFLAPPRLSQTLVIASAQVTAVAPRPFYTRALRPRRLARTGDRMVLNRFILRGLGPRQTAPRVRRALRRLGVDVACAHRAQQQRLLERAGYERHLVGSGYWCGIRSRG